MEQTECSEMSAHTIQTERNHPKERIKQIILIFSGDLSWLRRTAQPRESMV
jgi:hypothetical protein